MTDDAPARRSTAVALGAALVAAVAATPNVGAALLGGLGLLVLGAGLHRMSLPVASLGALALLAASLLVGLSSVPVLVPLVGVAASVLTWDAAGTAVDVGRHLGRDVETAPLELAHVGATAAVVTVATGFGYALFRIGTGARPDAALFALLAAALLLVVAVDR